MSLTISMTLDDNKQHWGLKGGSAIRTSTGQVGSLWAYSIIGQLL